MEETPLSLKLEVATVSNLVEGKSVQEEVTSDLATGVRRMTQTVEDDPDYEWYPSEFVKTVVGSCWGNSSLCARAVHSDDI